MTCPNTAPRSTPRPLTSAVVVSDVDGYDYAVRVPGDAEYPAAVNALARIRYGSSGGGDIVVPLAGDTRTAARELAREMNASR